MGLQMRKLGQESDSKTQKTLPLSLARSSDMKGPPAHTTTSSILGGSGFQEGTRPAKDKLERHSQEGSMKNGTYLGRGGGSSCQQTCMTLECSPVYPRGCGLYQGQGHSQLNE